MGKVIIFSAPSGSGKSTIVNYLLAKDLGLEFSVSATCRAPRGEEKHGKEYYFFSTDEFKKRIEAKDFLEWEEVYPGCFYGTLKSELERIWKAGHAVVFDVDVVGGVNIKKIFGDQALSVFIKAPSVEVLRQRSGIGIAAVTLDIKSDHPAALTAEGYGGHAQTEILPISTLV